MKSLLDPDEIKALVNQIEQESEKREIMNNDNNGFQFSGATYEKVKMFVQLVLPALITLYFTIDQILDLPHTDEVMGITAAVTTFLGVMLRISTGNYKKDDTRFVGETYIAMTDEDELKRVFNVTADNIDPTKKELTFKVVDQIAG